MRCAQAWSAALNQIGVRLSKVWERGAAQQNRRRHGACFGGSLGAAGALTDSAMAFAFATVRLELFSQIPKSTNGSAVAATNSLARRGILDSGSQRNSCADKKKVRQAHKASEARAISTSRFQRAADQ